MHSKASIRIRQRVTYPAAALLVMGVATGLWTGCDDRDPTGVELPPAPPVREGSSGVAANLMASPSPGLAAGKLSLPQADTVSSGGESAFSITQTGTGGVAKFRIANPANSSIAFRAETDGAGYALQGISHGQAISGYFSNSGYSSKVDALQSVVSGGGNAVHGTATGIGRAAFFENTLYNNSNSVLAVRTMGTGWAGVFLAPQGGKGVLITVNSGMPGLQVVGGTKNAVVHTPSGAKALYTEESSEVWFTDYGFGKIENGRARIAIDPAFAQTINPREPYHVFVQSYGDAELYVKERTPQGFEVALRAGDPQARFGYRIVAKRLERAPWADHPADKNGIN
jgi:hypothetical protein